MLKITMGWPCSKNFQQENLKMNLGKKVLEEKSLLES